MKLSIIVQEVQEELMNLVNMIRHLLTPGLERGEPIPLKICSDVICVTFSDVKSLYNGSF